MDSIYLKNCEMKEGVAIFQIPASVFRFHFPLSSYFWPLPLIAICRVQLRTNKIYRRKIQCPHQKFVL